MTLNYAELINCTITLRIFWASSTHQGALALEDLRLLPKCFNIFCICPQVDLLRKTLNHVCKGILDLSCFNIGIVSM